MKIEHPERIRAMMVCRACEDVVGWFYRLDGMLAGQHQLLQRGRCARHPPLAGAPRWPRFDFNRGVDLCYCCAIEPLATGSKWSVWFCEPCKQQVGLLNARHGRCIVPIGRHSVHRGHLLRAEDLDDAIVVESFVGAFESGSVAIRTLADWQRVAVVRNLDALGDDDRLEVPALEYWREVAAAVDRMDRFREMCAYLDERGRARLTPGTESGR
jgi:hypothetical protein